MSKTTIPTGGIADGGISTAKLADDAVSAAKIADAVALGKLLQIVTATEATELDLSSETFTDVGLSASITPSATSSKVLVFWNIHGRIMESANGYGSQLVRGSTNIWSTVRPYYIFGDYTNERHAPSFNYLDSPSTTSATTYKIQVNTNSDKRVLFNANDIPSIITLMEIGA